MLEPGHATQPGHATRFEVDGQSLSRNALIAKSVGAVAGGHLTRKTVSSKVQTLQEAVERAARTPETDFCELNL